MFRMQSLPSFLLLTSQTGVVTKATYAGTAAPFNEAAAIRDFFVEEVPDAPDTCSNVMGLLAHHLRLVRN